MALIPGRVSIEIDARLSFNTEKTVEKAIRIIELFERDGYPKERILIRIAATWEGIQAARILERHHGIHCNITLLFNIHQAVACANAGVTLISPFVDRIMDWYLKLSGKMSFTRENDPGVSFVKEVFYYFKKFGIKTEIMAASFRNAEEILGLGGLDCITISPALLHELSELPASSIGGILSAENSQRNCSLQNPIEIPDKEAFYDLLKRDKAAFELLHGGIDKFVQDTVKLEKFFSDFYKHC